MKQTFQGIPQAFPQPSVLTAANNGGNLSADTYYFWLQGRNRQGYNEPSLSIPVIVGVNDTLSVTVPGTCIPDPDGSEILEYLILAATTNDVNQASVVAKVDGDEVLPTTVDFTNDIDLEIGAGQFVTEVNQLPTLPVHGCRRHLDDWGEIREWNANVAAWQRVEPQLFNTGDIAIDGLNGARRSLGLITDTSVIRRIPYGATGAESEACTFWLVNDTSLAVTAGRGITLSVDAAGEDISTQVNNGALEIMFVGYASMSTAQLDTLNAEETGEMDGVGEWLQYPGPTTGLTLQKDLPTDTAYVVAVRWNFTEISAQFTAAEGATLGFAFGFDSAPAIVAPIGLFTGSIISQDSRKRRIVPTTSLSAIALPGAGIVKISSALAYLFYDRPPQSVSGLLGNTDDQKVWITAQGNCYASNTGSYTSALRAIAGTVNGIGKAVKVHNGLTLNSGQSLSVVVTYPASIRGDYPDVIAGSLDGQFNADSVRIYAKPTGGGNIIYWDGSITPGAAGDSFYFDSAGTNLGGTELPTVANDFGLYAPIDEDIAVVTVPNPGNIPSGVYEIWLAFGFSGTLTRLSHSTIHGCIPEAAGGMADLFSFIHYFHEPVKQLGNLRAIPESDRYPYRELYAISEGNKARWHPLETETTDLDLEFETSTANNPGAGGLRINDTDTWIYVSVSDRDGYSVDAVIGEILSNAYVRIDFQDDPFAYRLYQTTGARQEYENDFRIPVVLRASNGALPSAGSLCVLSADSSVVRPFDLPRGEAGRWVMDESTEIHLVSGAPGSGIGENRDLSLSLDPSKPEFGDIYLKMSGAWGSALANIFPYTFVAAAFVQPAIYNNVDVYFRNSGILFVGANIFIEGGGYYEVVNRIDEDTVRIKNISADGNTAVGTTIPVNSKTFISGPKGLGSATAGSTGTPDSREGVTETGTTRSLTADDVGKTIQFSSSSDIEVDILPNASAAIEINKIIHLGRQGSGQVVLRPGQPVTVNGLAIDAANQIQISKQWGVIELRQIEIDQWWASQDWEAVSSTYTPPVDLLSNLLSWHSFDEISGDRADSHTGGYDLTDESIGSTTGIVGNAAAFTGSGSNTLYSSNAAYDFTGSFYVAVWVYLNSTGSFQVILGKYDSFAKERSWMLQFNSFNTDFRWALSADGENDTSIFSGITPTTNTWYFVECYYDSDNNQGGIAVNGGEFVTAAHSGGLFSSPEYFRVGGARVSTGIAHVLDGRVDELAIYTSIPSDLSASSAFRQALYNLGNGISYPAGS